MDFKQQKNTLHMHKMPAKWYYIFTFTGLNKKIGFIAIASCDCALISRGSLS